VLKVLHAGTSDLPPYFTESQLERFAEQEKQTEAEEVLAIRAFAGEHVGEERAFEARFMDDSPSAAILEEIGKADTILVALGTHGRGGFEKLRFGSVAEAVLREARGAVLLAGPSVEIRDEARVSRILCVRRGACLCF